MPSMEALTIILLLILVFANMNQPNFSTCQERECRDRQLLLPPDLEAGPDLDRPTAKLLIGIFVAAVSASAATTVYLFDRQQPDIIPTQELTPAIVASLPAIARS